MVEEVSDQPPDVAIPGRLLPRHHPHLPPHLQRSKGSNPAPPPPPPPHMKA